MGSIPGLGVIRHLGQLSLPSIQGRLIEYQPSLAGVKAECVRLCQVARNIVRSLWQATPCSSEMDSYMFLQYFDTVGWVF